MSVNEPNKGSSPIVRGSPLARALDDFAVPGLPAGFADRVLAAAEARPAPLPPLRRPSAGRRWRIGQRLAIGVASFGALATAAAATGLLEQLAIPVPSAQTVWASITGKEPANAAVSAAVPAVSKPADIDPVALAPVAIVGPIDTPEELGEAFRRIDEVRQGRSEARRQFIDQRIDSAIERRRAEGLPVPTPEGEARLRERIDAVQAEREGIAAERIQARREELERKVENGEALTREDFLPARPQGMPRLRDLTPAERRAVLQDLSPEDRRAVAEEYRQWRLQRENQQRLRRAGSGEAAAAPVPQAAPTTAPDEAAAPQPQTADTGEE